MADTMAPRLYRRLAQSQRSESDSFSALANLQGFTSNDSGAGRSSSWIDNVYINLSAAEVWSMPTIKWMRCEDFMNAYVVINCDYFSGSGTLTLTVETAPFMSTNANAWRMAGTITVSERGVQGIKVRRFDAIPITGLIRIKMLCNTSAVAATLRVDLLLKENVPSKSLEWLQATYVSMLGSGSTIMPADMWLNIMGFVDLWLLVDFHVTSGGGSTLTVTLQTAPAYSIDDNAWQDVGTAVVMGTSPQVYDARVSVVHGPQGIVRLKYTATAAVTGVLRVQALLKDN